LERGGEVSGECGDSTASWGVTAKDCDGMDFCSALDTWHKRGYSAQVGVSPVTDNSPYDSRCPQNHDLRST
jgi:hypothetical protein